MTQTTPKTPATGQQGFTLIEIIAVLVILGILAAVAVPRYFDMQDDAKDAAIQGALAACSGELNMQFAKNIISGNSTTDFSASNVSVGDFTCDFSNGGGNGNYTVTLSSGPSWFSDYTASNNSTNVVLYTN
jgi:prepilin-type N-terminal cleavage/methylation domain-containing protein